MPKICGRLCCVKKVPKEQQDLLWTLWYCSFFDKEEKKTIENALKKFNLSFDFQKLGDCCWSFSDKKVGFRLKYQRKTMDMSMLAWIVEINEKILKPAKCPLSYGTMFVCYNEEEEDENLSFSLSIQGGNINYDKYTTTRVNMLTGINPSKMKIDQPHAFGHIDIDGTLATPFRRLFNRIIGFTDYDGANEDPRIEDKSTGENIIFDFIELGPCFWLSEDATITRRNDRLRLDEECGMSIGSAALWLVKLKKDIFDRDHCDLRGKVIIRHEDEHGDDRNFVAIGCESIYDQVLMTLYTVATSVWFEPDSREGIDKRLVITKKKGRRSSKYVTRIPPKSLVSEEDAETVITKKKEKEDRIPPKSLISEEEEEEEDTETLITKKKEKEDRTPPRSLVSKEEEDDANEVLVTKKKEKEKEEEKSVNKSTRKRGADKETELEERFIRYTKAKSGKEETGIKFVRLYTEEDILEMFDAHFDLQISYISDLKGCGPTDEKVDETIEDLSEIQAEFLCEKFGIVASKPAID